MENNQEVKVAWCMKCQVKREITNPEETTLKNGRLVLKGTCSVCGTKVFKFLKKKENAD